MSECFVGYVGIKDMAQQTVSILESFNCEMSAGEEVFCFDEGVPMSKYANFPPRQLRLLPLPEAVQMHIGMLKNIIVR